MLTKLTVAGMISIAVLAAVARTETGTVSAQYPPPSGNCVILTSATTATPGGSVNVTVTVRDVDGKPLANVPVPLVISQQPGGDASIVPGATTTDANGQVTGTLNVGTASGVVEVSATASGVACRASVVSGKGEVAARVDLPNTGTGPTAGDGVMPSGLLAILLAGLGTVVAGAALRRSERGS
ncbi:MAG: hypothetical protein HY874_08125 [Chloroflexi bacterium]|nr:hypothetical protein [Chloroflexota bacterium]